MDGEGKMGVRKPDLGTDIHGDKHFGGEVLCFGNCVLKGFLCNLGV